MKLCKISAAGNDFLIAGPAHPSRFSPLLIQRLCERHFGIGADGVLLTSGDGDNASWWFYNSDGSEASFCGNGARALALFENQLNSSVRSGKRKTPAGELSYVLSDDNTSVLLTFPRQWTHNGLADTDREALVSQWIPEAPSGALTCVFAGVRHLCIPLKQRTPWPPTENWLRWARLVHDELKRRAWDMNLTVYSPMEHSKVSAVTFERGIDGATLACGSGALSVAHVVQPSGSVTVEMPGGALTIEHGDKQTTLRGPVQFIATIESSAWGVPV